MSTMRGRTANWPGLFGISGCESGPEFGGDLVRDLPRLIHLARFEADRAHPRMAAAAVALADGCQVMPRLLGRPRIRPYRDLCPETRRAHRHRVRAPRIQVIRDELVVAFEIVAGEVERNDAAR